MKDVGCRTKEEEAPFPQSGKAGGLFIFDHGDLFPHLGTNALLPEAKLDIYRKFSPGRGGLDGGTAHLGLGAPTAQGNRDQEKNHEQSRSNQHGRAITASAADEDK